MRIPVSPGRQVQQQPMSGFVAQNTAVQAPSVVGAFGEALGQVSEVQKWAAQVPVQDSLNQLNASLMKIKTDAGQQLGASVRPDKDGKSFTDRHLVEFDKNMERVASNLKSSTQKTMFSQRAAILRQSLQGDLYAHETKEMKADAVDVNQSTISLMNEQAKANLGNLQALTLNQVQIDSAVKDQALLLGWSPEETQVQRQKAMDQFHGGVIGAAIDAGSLGYAKTYLENHANDMSADLKAKAQGVIQKKEGDLTVDVAVETIFKQLGPKNDKEAVSLDKMNAAIPENLTPEAKKAVRQGLQEMAHAHDYSVKQRENATVSDFYQSIEKGANWAQIKKTPAFDALDGKVQDSLRKHYEQERGIVKGGEGGGVPSNAASEYWNLVDNPDKLKGMSVNEIIAMTPVLGKSYRDQALKRREQLNKPEGAGKISVDQDVLKTEYRSALNYKPDRKLTEADRNTLAELEIAVKQAQEASGVSWSMENTQKLVRQMVKPVVTRDKWYSKKEEPFFKAVQQVPAEYAAVVRRKAPNATPEQIAQAYFLDKQNGLVD